ncbi:MAG: hypothetical protein ACSLFO_05885 [Acidimicrobiales bacterium]
MLEDGTYDAIVFDADGDPDSGNGAITVELTILSGPHKGEVVSVRTADWAGDALDLLAVPATITVTSGEPRVRFEP